MMPEEGYINASNRLLAVASKSLVHIGGREVNLLVESAANQEHAEGRYPHPSREKVEQDMRMLVASWTVVLLLVAEYFRVRFFASSSRVQEY